MGGKMPINFSVEATRAFFAIGKEKALENCQQKYLAGDRSSILSALVICAIWRVPMPYWVEDELISVDSKIENFEIDDLNHFFGFIPEHKSTQKHRNQIRKFSKTVTAALFSHRLNGGNFNDDDGLQSVSEQTKVPLRIVKEIYQERKDWLKSLPTDGSRNVGYGELELPGFDEFVKFRRDKLDK